MRITAIRTQKRRTDRVSVDVDGEFHCGAPAELVERLGLRVGDDVDASMLEHLEQGNVQSKARDAALRLLAHRPRARAELRDRLRRKEFDDATIETCMAWLDERGYVDDHAFAEAWIRDRIRLRPKAPRALIAELLRKGVDGDVAAHAVTAALEEAGVTEADLALDVARAWIRRNPPRRGAEEASREASLARRRRLYGHLARRGFGGEVARAAVTEGIRNQGIRNQGIKNQE